MHGAYRGLINSCSYNAVFVSIICGGTSKKRKEGSRACWNLLTGRREWKWLRITALESKTGVTCYFLICYSCSLHVLHLLSKALISSEVRFSKYSVTYLLFIQHSFPRLLTGSLSSLLMRHEYFGFDFLIYGYTYWLAFIFSLFSCFQGSLPPFFPLHTFLPVYLLSRHLFSLHITLISSILSNPFSPPTFHSGSKGSFSLCI